MFSVALCTYNGQQFLRQQLESLSRQTLSPLELVVRDDYSSDATMSILQNFAERAPFPVRIFQNERTLGVTQNFGRVLGDCHGDYVALCDQDDIWLPQKLDRMSKYFTDNPKTSVIFTDALVIDDQGLLTSKRLSERIGFRRSQVINQIAERTILVTLAKRNICTGATLAVRREILVDALPIPLDFGPSIIHDAWLSIFAAAQNSLAYLDECLIHYREHLAQQIGPSVKTWSFRKRLGTNAPEYRRLLSQRAAFVEKLLSVLHQRLGDTECLTQLQQLADHYQMRANLPKSRTKRLRPIMQSLFAGDYHRNSSSLLVKAAGDFLL